MTLSRWGARRGDGGASAVEFALVVPLLVVLVFGIIDYGVYFASSLGLRQGVREGARTGAIGGTAMGSNSTCATWSTPAPSTDMKDLICLTLSDIGLGSYPTAVKVSFATVGSTPGYVQGNNLIVCAQSKVNSVTNLVPYPKGGLITSSVTIRIENTAFSNSSTEGYGYVGGLSSPDWTQC